MSETSLLKNQHDKVVSRKRNPVQEIAPITLEQIQLSEERNALDREIENLRTLHVLEEKVEKQNEIAERIKKLEAQSADILDRLGEARKEEFGDEAALARMMRQPKRTTDRERNEQIASAMNEKEALEKARYKLNGELTLAKGERKNVIGINVARSDVLGKQIPLMEAELEQTDKQLLKNLEQLSELDPKRFKKELDEAIAFAAMTSRGLEKLEETEIDDLLAKLHEGIEKEN